VYRKRREAYSQLGLPQDATGTVPCLGTYSTIFRNQGLALQLPSSSTNQERETLFGNVGDAKQGRQKGKTKSNCGMGGMGSFLSK